MDSNGAPHQTSIRQPSGRMPIAVLGLCFVLAALSRGTVETFTVFLLPVSTTFGWDRAQVVSVYSIGALCSGLSAPFVGRLFDRSGPRSTSPNVPGGDQFGTVLFTDGAGQVTLAVTDPT